jgi:hypothetical protein
MTPGHFIKFGIHRSPLHPAPKPKPKPRTLATAFFAGRVCFNNKCGGEGGAATSSVGQRGSTLRC